MTVDLSEQELRRRAFRLEWWWADPAAALVVAGFASWSGLAAWREAAAR